jgi:hypothetical protein
MHSDEHPTLVLVVGKVCQFFFSSIYSAAVAACAIHGKVLPASRAPALSYRLTSAYSPHVGADLICGTQPQQLARRTAATTKKQTCLYRTNATTKAGAFQIPQRIFRKDFYAVRTSGTDLPQTSSAVSATRRNFASWSAGVTALPSIVDANPHCGLSANRSIGTKAEAA